MDYGSIDAGATATAPPSLISSESNIKTNKIIINDLNLLVCVIIFVNLLNDNQTFIFLMRVFTQLLIFNIPDLDDLLPSFVLLEHEEQQLQLSRLNAVISIVLPYSIINSVFSVVIHYKLISKIGVVGFDYRKIPEYINYQTALKLNGKYFYDSIFINLIGEFDINSLLIADNNNIFTVFCIFKFIFIDLLILVLQLIFVYKIKCVWSNRLHS